MRRDVKAIKVKETINTEKKLVIDGFEYEFKAYFKKGYFFLEIGTSNIVNFTAAYYIDKSRIYFKYIEAGIADNNRSYFLDREQTEFFLSLDGMGLFHIADENYMTYEELNIFLEEYNKIR